MFTSVRDLRCVRMGLARAGRFFLGVTLAVSLQGSWLRAPAAAVGLRPRLGRLIPNPCEFLHRPLGSGWTLTCCGEMIQRARGARVTGKDSGFQGGSLGTQMGS